MRKFYGDGWCLPSTVQVNGNLSRRLPTFAWALDRRGVATNGAGSPQESLWRTLGEYFERRHFYTEVRGDQSGRLDELQPIWLQSALRRSLPQTCVDAVRPAIDTHRFSLNQVVELPNWDAVLAPSILFSVSGVGLADDGRFLNARDTTGCAVHFDLRRALVGATRELVERQYLLRYWLTGRGGRDITPQLEPGLASTSRELVARLSQTGSVRFLEIGDTDVRAAIVMCVYRGTADNQVRYCVGLSCGATAVGAADKAVNELWQCYLFLRSMSGVKNVSSLVHDRYHTYFIECNRLETADAMLEGAQADGTQVPTEDDDDRFMESVHARLGRLLMYARPVRVLQRWLWCVRVVCPAAFLHIDNSRYFNLDCDFAATFRTALRPDRLSVMVPFP